MEEELEIPRNRAEQLTFIKKSWNNTEIGTYIEQRESRPIKEMIKKTFKWTRIDVQIKHHTKLRIYTWRKGS